MSETEKELEKLEKRIRRNDIAIVSWRERVFMLENKLDKLQAKKEINYVELINSLLNHINNSREKQYIDYIEVIRELIKKE